MRGEVRRILPPGREGWAFTLGAWVGARPGGMPSDAINLAALGAVDTLVVISLPFAPAQLEDYYGEIATPFGPDNVSLDIGIPGSATLYTAGTAPEGLSGGLQYPPNIDRVTQLQIIVSSFPSTHLGDLTGGQLTITLNVMRHPLTIGRLSP